MRILYTSYFNNYDTLQPVSVPQGWRAMCFTDNPQPVKGWEIIPTEPAHKLFRKIKSCPHLFLPPHDLSVWIDANLSPRMPVNHIVNGKTGYWAMEHPQRRCIYQEAIRCKELRKDDEDIIDAQMARYRAEKYPEKNGLVATGVLIRNGAGYESFGEDWFAEIERGSVRDQLSWNYVAHKHRLHYKTFPFLMGFTKTLHTGRR